MQKAKKRFPGAGQFDKINSTFRSRIIFNSTQRVPHLDGYSKGLLQEKEPEDKIYMLQCWLVRLYNTGYFSPSKTIRIEFYEKKFLENNDEQFLILEPYSYQILTQKYLLNTRLNKFLERLYAAIKSKKPITKELVDIKIVFNEQDIWNLNKKIFTTEQELREWCIAQKASGKPEGAVYGIYHKYKAKYL